MLFVLLLFSATHVQSSAVHIMIPFNVELCAAYQLCCLLQSLNVSCACTWHHLWFFLAIYPRYNIWREGKRERGNLSWCYSVHDFQPEWWIQETEGKEWYPTRVEEEEEKRSYRLVSFALKAMVKQAKVRAGAEAGWKTFLGLLCQHPQR